MSTQITKIFDGDGNPMTPDQLEISRLKKANAANEQKLADVVKRLEALESKHLEADSKERRGPKF